MFQIKLYCNNSSLTTTDFFTGMTKAVLILSVQTLNASQERFLKPCTNLVCVTFFAGNKAQIN